MIATAGDRRDQDMIDLGREAAKHFDRIIVREDERLRGRARGETAELIVQGAKQAQAEGGRVKQIEVVLDEIEATRVGRRVGQPGRPGGGLRRPGPRRLGRAAGRSANGRRPVRADEFDDR